MAYLVLVRDGEPIGYVDTETPEWEYNGDDSVVRGLIGSQVGRKIGSPSDDWSADYEEFDGEELETYIRSLPEEFPERVDFEVVTDENFEGGRKPPKDESE